MALANLKISSGLYCQGWIARLHQFGSKAMLEMPGKQARAATFRGRNVAVSLLTTSHTLTVLAQPRVRLGGDPPQTSWRQKWNFLVFFSEGIP